jgi:hypothetical protein
MRLVLGGVQHLRRAGRALSGCARLWAARDPTRRTIRIRSLLLATAITCLPRPLPSDAPSIMPGKSSSYAPRNRAREQQRQRRTAVPCSAAQRRACILAFL